MFKTLLNSLSNLSRYSNKRSLAVISRHYATKKRFYQKTDILHSEGKFEVTLDRRKLKSPNKKPFALNNEALALGIATEWDAQKHDIDLSNMHLNALSSTVIDNPSNLTKFDMVNYIVNFLPTDAILFHSHINDALYDLQCKEWDPLIDWVNKKFEVNIAKSRSITPSEINADSKMKISNYLLSHNFSAMQGFVFATDTVKSVILTLAAVEKYISIENAVYLSRLEEEFQLGHWGRVEWAHDLNQLELQARLSAAVLFVHLNSSELYMKAKLGNQINPTQ